MFYFKKIAEVPEVAPNGGENVDILFYFILTNIIP